MSFEYFLVKRLVKNKSFNNTITAPVIKIAIIAVALGLIVMLIAIATGLGLQHKIREKISAFNGYIEISNYDNNESQVSLKPINIHQDFYPQFTDVPSVNHVQAVLVKSAILRTEENFQGVLIKGVGSDYKWDVFEEYLQEGRLPNYQDKLNNEILISKKIADRLNYSLNDKVIAYFVKENGKFNIRALKITGIYDSGYKDFDTLYVFADIRHLQKMNKWSPDEVGGFEVFVDDFSDIQNINRQVYANISSYLDSNTIIDKFPQIFQWIDLFDMNIVAVIGIMVLVAAINMVTAILILILERTQLIGVLKSLGANNLSIRKVFVYMASHIVLKGLLYGNIIGLGGLLVQYYFQVVTLNPENYYVRVAPVFIEWYHIVFLNIGTIGLCCVMMWFSSYLITRVSPVNVIKFQ